MFVYLSKKIQIPNGILLHALSWNKDQGWIACGGEGGLVKVLKLDAVPAKEIAARGLAATSNLSMNQPLEGHAGSVVCVTWNDQFQKLTTSDSNGLIIVWMLYKGMWYEEMINNRNKSVVRAMKWSSDGHKICIVYEDGMVIVGSVDGNRLWGKELKLLLAQVEWSPDGRSILFGSTDGDVHVFDHAGSFVVKMPIMCLDEGTRGAKIIGIEWYAGIDAYGDGDTPCLAVCFDNGRLQIMRNQYDEKPVLIDTQMTATSIKWNPQGTVLAVSGQSRMGDSKNQVQFYTPNGMHLRTLNVPSTSLAAISWEGAGLRLAIAVDASIYFAAIRPDYKWGYFGKTLAYATRKADRPEHCVVFWDTKSDDRVVKYVKKLVSIHAGGENCLLVTRTDDPSQYLLILCNAIGTPIDSKYIDIEPLHVTMTRYHVVVASEETVYVWQYSTALSKLTSIDAASATKRKEGRERMFHIDDLPSADTGVLLRKSDRPTTDAVCSVCASETMMIIGRESGTIHRYALPHISLDQKYILRCRPFQMALNCTSSRLSIVDINGVLSFFDLDSRPEGAAPTAPLGNHLGFERKDVWDMRWSDDNPEQFVCMEKTRMYIMRNLDLEEPVTSSGFLCRFNNLRIKAVLLDEVMQAPDHPNKELILKFETKSLRDSRSILASVGIKDALQFIEDNPHPRLWRILAEAALDKLDFNVAERAFVKCQDFHAIQLVKRLRQLDDKAKQKAEVAIYFKRFDEAEELYTSIDRRDLALDMRMRLGDWFRVLNLTQSGVGNDTLKMRALNEIGDYYADRQKWSEAAAHFSQAGNLEKLVECHYMLEDFTALENTMKVLPDKSPLLFTLGEKFMHMGIYENAVSAFLRVGDVKMAVDVCVMLNQWDTAVELAEKHSFPAIEGLLSKYASHLMEKGQILSAIELYRKANHHLDAAKLLMQQARDIGKTKSAPLVAKKIWILAALEVEAHRSKMLHAQVARGFQAGNLIDGERSDRMLDNPWHGAEAYHFFLLAQRQLYDNKAEAALCTALRLRDYEDVLGQFNIYSLVALAAYYSRNFGQCSRAFIVLESMEDLEEQKKQGVNESALGIFIKNSPKDTRRGKSQCPTCDQHLEEWDTQCPACESAFPPCVATGVPIRNGRFYVCSQCKHRISEDVPASKLIVCPLCHAKL